MIGSLFLFLSSGLPKSMFSILPTLSFTLLVFPSNPYMIASPSLLSGSCLCCCLPRSVIPFACDSVITPMMFVMVVFSCRSRLLLLGPMEILGFLFLFQYLHLVCIHIQMCILVENITLSFCFVVWLVCLILSHVSLILIILPNSLGFFLCDVVLCLCF